MMPAMLQVMVDVPAELHDSLLPKQQQQQTREVANAEMPLQTLAGHSEVCKGAACQQNASIIDLTDDVEPAAKRHCA